MNALQTIPESNVQPVPSITASYALQVTSMPVSVERLVNQIVDVVEISDAGRMLFEAQKALPESSEGVTPEDTEAISLGWYRLGLIDGFDLPGPVTPREEEQNDPAHR